MASIAKDVRAALNGRLPPRYDEVDRHFRERVRAAVVPGARILDVGSGRHPAVPLAARPPGCTYVGLDISRTELEHAPPNSYDEIVVADVTDPVPELVGSFDVVLSWQVLEHVRPIDRGLENMRSYLRPGGRLIAQMSGAFSPAVLGKVVPARPRAWILVRLLNRPPEDMFPVEFDRCWHGALERMMRHWTSAEIVPIFAGAGYFKFFRPLQAAYIGYEQWAVRGERRNLATYYVIDAAR